MERKEQEFYDNYQEILFNSDKKFCRQCYSCKYWRSGDRKNDKYDSLYCQKYVNPQVKPYDVINNNGKCPYRRDWDDWDDEYGYPEIKEDRNRDFDHFLTEGWNSFNITSYFLENMDYSDETFCALNFIAIARKEIEINQFEPRIHDQICYYVPAFISGKYDLILDDTEKKLIKNDIAYILKTVDLYEVKKKKDDNPLKYYK